MNLASWPISAAGIGMHSLPLVDLKMSCKRDGIFSLSWTGRFSGDASAFLQRSEQRDSLGVFQCVQVSVKPSRALIKPRSLSWGWLEAN